MIDIDAERLKFESAMNDARFFPAELDFVRTKSPSGRDEYANSHLQSCWVGWQARATTAPAPAAQPPGTRQCGQCDGKGVIYQCVVCCSSEPGTGTCGSSDPRALCNFVAPAPAAPEGQAVQKLSMSMVASRDYLKGWNECLDAVAAVPRQAAVAGEPKPIAYMCPNDPDVSSAFKWAVPGVDYSTLSCDMCGDKHVPVFRGRADGEA